MKAIKIYTDGSSIGNPGPGGWAAVIYFDNKVKELGGYGGDESTNNKMEINSSIEALKFVYENIFNKDEDIKIEICSDSAYLINGITKWIFGWMKNGWVNKMEDEVANRDLWEKLHFYTSKMKVSWSKVAGHSGVHVNERCDIIANGFATKEDVKLFDGDESEYEKAVNLGERRSSSKTKGQFKNTESKGLSDMNNIVTVSKKPKSGYYISYVNQILMKHETWTECEARVKGVKGAKFKKVKDLMEEEAVVKQWIN